MDRFTKPEFTEALARLQPLLGRKVNITMTLAGRYFDAGLVGVLERVRSIAPDHSAVSIELESGEGLAVDPAELHCFAWARPGEPPFVCFEIIFGPSILIELDASELAHP